MKNKKQVQWKYCFEELTKLLDPVSDPIRSNVNNHKYQCQKYYYDIYWHFPPRWYVQL